MTTRNRLPPLIEHCFRLPHPLSLILLTGTLECSPNWLTARFAAGYLDPKVIRSGETRLDETQDTGVVFVSFSNDLSYWKGELRRTTGVDLTSLITANRFAYVDVFNQLSKFAPAQALTNTEKLIEQSLAKLHKADRHIYLILDNPDLLLSLGMATAFDLNHLILRLRSNVHATLISASGDLPYLGAATCASALPPTPIEVESAQFLVQQAHIARFVMSTRALQTGAAKDISGVLSITNGGFSEDLQSRPSDEQADEPEMEVRYLVQRDGNVKIYEER